MKRFKNILFIADGSHGEKSALSRAIALCKLNEAKLTLMDVLDLDGGYSVDPKTEQTISELQQELCRNKLDELGQMGEEIDDLLSNRVVSISVKTGDVAVEIIRAVIRNDHDLVIKAPEQPAGAFLRLFGSVDMKLMRKSPCAVWICKDSKQQNYQNILAAVNLNPANAETEALSRKIMTIASSLSAMESCDLHVAHIWRLVGEHKMREQQATTPAVDRLLVDIQDKLESQFKSLLEEFPSERRYPHLLKGHPGSLIPTIVKTLSIDLIVIGTVGRTGIPGFIFGNTAEKVLGAVDCSVLTLKPDGFESPIKLDPEQ